MTTPNVPEHIGSIIARMTADVANRQARWLQHERTCPYWWQLVPTDCSCSTRAVIDLLLYIAQRKAA